MEPPKVGDTWFSYRNSTGGYVHLVEWTVTALTPRGVWLLEEHAEYYGTSKIWVSCHTVKRKAYPDKEAAWKSFQYRTKQAVAWAELRLHQRRALLTHVTAATTEAARLGPVLGYNPPSLYRHEYD